MAARAEQLSLSFPCPQLPGGDYRTTGARAIEEPGFPFEHLSAIAELESWRKEVYRPIYHVHKWWAQRLGSVFRAIIMGSFAPAGADVLELFYQPTRFPGVVVFDPFMGSGTTVGEALKLGGRAIGRDINPVAYFLVKNALGLPRRDELVRTFASIEQGVAAEIRQYYDAQLPDGRRAHVLYYFWVKQVACPRCRDSVDLFSTYIFAQHAYPRRNPAARALCPSCGQLSVVRYDAREVQCGSCQARFDPACGPARGANATCPKCREVFRIARAASEAGVPPSHRLYAKLVVTAEGTKRYLPADEQDRELYERAAVQLAKRPDAYPMVPIAPGYNTNQVLRYSYRYWHQMFNARQLLCVSILAERVRSIPEERIRDVFCCLFSGVLEFNNMFASFKGEGTGAVRHMFHHHILKPERTPLEANVWGTPWSSGSFSTLFRSRILRAHEYCQHPFEVRALSGRGGVGRGQKVFGLSTPLFHERADTFAEFASGKRLYLSCGDSSLTDLADDSVDAVVTDPPFFDNVHYSQLADFFYVWQRHLLGPMGVHSAESTRTDREVQHTESETFQKRLTRVWQECHRVLKRDGLLVFTYHHSRPESWGCLLSSLTKGGFMVGCAHPIKAEMSVATPKHQAKEPIDVDVIFVCRKRQAGTADPPRGWPEPLVEGLEIAEGQVRRFSHAGRRLGRGDVRVILMAQIVSVLSRLPENCDLVAEVEALQPSIDGIVDRLFQQGSGSRTQQLSGAECDPNATGSPAADYVGDQSSHQLTLR